MANLKPTGIPADYPALSAEVLVYLAAFDPRARQELIRRRKAGDA